MLGVVSSIESNHKAVPTARKGLEVCIKIENVGGEAPKMFGRHFDENDMLLSKVKRTLIPLDSFLTQLFFKTDFTREY